MGFKGVKIIYACFRDVNLNRSVGEFSRLKIDATFLIFLQKTGFDISCKLSPPKETISMKFQSLMSRKNKKIYFKMSSAENFTQHSKREM